MRDIHAIAVSRPEQSPIAVPRPLSLRSLEVLCPVEQAATCCEDHQHCCPSNLPVCDTIAGRCLSGKGNDWESSEPWVSKVRACSCMTR